MEFYFQGTFYVGGILMRMNKDNFIIDEKFVIKTLRDLVSINSINPSLDKNGNGEEEIGLYIWNTLKSMQVESEIILLSPKRVNVIGTLRGSSTGKSLMINAHMDTVGVEGMDEPFSATIHNGKLYGRGAYDMKGSIAAMFGIAKAIKDKKIILHGDVLLTFVADEEYESIGTCDVLRHYKTNAAIVTEPTDLRICIGHRGFGVYKIKTKGKIAHGGLQQEGIDANTKMGLLLAELDKLANKIAIEKIHPLCGRASLHVPLIEGGQSLFIYSGECTIQVERRTLPGEREDDILRELNEIIDIVSTRDKNFHAEIEPFLWRDPYEVSKDADIVKALTRSATKVIGTESSYIGHSWWEDSALIGREGINTVIIGPRGAGIHQQVEWVEIQSVFDLSNILYETIVDYCGK
jgi:acetylornithine deacetylase